MPPSTSTRWCPTPEQVMILEELYRRGLRSPNSGQIQKITGHLSFYGKIQGKNVFYWFQNHKARDRQKLRKKIVKQQQQQLRLLYPNLGQINQETLFGGINFERIRALPAGLNALPTNSCSTHLALHPHRHHHQFGGMEEYEYASGREREEQTASAPWISDLPKDHHYTMSPHSTYDKIMEFHEVGPPPSSPRLPLQTLELFPLVSPHAKTNLNQETAASSSSNSL